MTRTSVLAAIVALCAGPAQATLTIQVNYTGPSQFEPAFTDAATIWEDLLVGYRGNDTQNVVIDAALAPNDGLGGILGSAGPTFGRVSTGGFVIATAGEMSFDSADAQNQLNQGQFDELVLHEMGHVLGFGTLWGFNNVYNNGSGEFLGPTAINIWRTEFGQMGDPDVELQGGPGTANGHWNENEFGAGLVGITDGLGRDMRDELMTGWLNPNSFISNLTIASFRDIGFTTVVSVPEAGSFLAFGLVFARFATTRRRQPSA